MSVVYLFASEELTVILETRNIEVEYGSVAVLSDITVSIGRGEFVAIAGPNGAGKSTLLRVLNGSVSPQNGEVFLDGESLGSINRAGIARRVSVVAQENETKFPMTVLEFVLAGMFVRGGAFGWETEEEKSVAAECLKLCGLEEFSTRLMNELSGGERQRVLLARAFATQARVLLLDEPTNNLDLSNQALMLKLVKERCTTCESTAVVVTHDLNLASEFADRVVLLDKGKIVADGAPSDVLTAENISKYLV